MRKFSFILLLIFICSQAFSQKAFNTKKKSSNTNVKYLNPTIEVLKASGRASATKVHYKGISLANIPGLIHYKLSEDGTFRFLEIKLEKAQSANENTELLVLSKLKGLQTVLFGEDISYELVKSEEDEMGFYHSKFTLSYKNIKIHASEFTVHISPKGRLILCGNFSWPNQDLKKEKVIDIRNAIEIVKRNLKTKTLLLEPKENWKTLLNHDFEPIEELIWYKTNTGYKLSHQITIWPNLLQRYEYFVDAKNGEIIDYYDHTCYTGPSTSNARDLKNILRTINTYELNGTYYLLDAVRPMYNSNLSKLPDNPVGGILTMDANSSFGSNLSVAHNTSSTNSWTQKNEVSAHYNAHQTYEFYSGSYQRNSFDDKGASIYSIVNVNDPQTGKGMDNAYWNGIAMFYGEGDVGFKPLAESLDVCGHEITHGVIQHTANLVYRNESGAINESMADVFGALIDSADWNMGEDIVRTSVFPSGALRSLSDPHNGGAQLGDPGWQPRHMNEKYTGTLDNGGVHINSGIPNWAFYKYATAVGKSKAGKTYYRVLDHYLTMSSKFADLRLAVVQSAKDLYGSGSVEEAAAKKAFDEVGLPGSVQAGNYQHELKVNPGTAYMFSIDTDPTNFRTLYRSSPSGTNFIAYSSTGFKSKPSLPDDGSAAVFVDDFDRIGVLNTDPTNINERILQSQAIWDNVVVSKDGSKMAAVTTSIDSSIHVYDFARSTWQTFKLYNPTFSSGVNSAGPRYADAMEWDYSGEYLIYDCFNELNNTSGANIEYWDINVIKVWDNKTNDFGSGQVIALFPNLPKDVSVGNPTYSKNSPHIIAFDLLDDRSFNTGYYVLGANIETGKVDTIGVNNTLGFPSYYKQDDRIAVEVENTSSNISTIVEAIIDTNKIKGTGNNKLLINYGARPVHYTVGVRNIIIGTQDLKLNEVSLFPNPFSESLIFTNHLVFENCDLEIYNIQGELLAIYNIPSLSSKNIETSSLSAGVYLFKTKANGKTKVFKRIKIFSGH